MPPSFFFLLGHSNFNSCRAATSAVFYHTQHSGTCTDRDNQMIMHMDAHGDITYSLTRHTRIFSIHPKTGEIKVKDASKVQRKSYLFGAKASNGIIFHITVPVYVSFVMIEMTGFKFSQDILRIWGIKFGSFFFFFLGHSNFSCRAATSAVFNNS